MQDPVTNIRTNFSTLFEIISQMWDWRLVTKEQTKVLTTSSQFFLFCQMGKMNASHIINEQWFSWRRAVLDYTLESVCTLCSVWGFLTREDAKHEFTKKDRALGVLTCSVKSPWAWNNKEEPYPPVRVSKTAVAWLLCLGFNITFIS